ncbi:MAG: beta-N-acetylhexosaminidase [Chitinispirillaceae bacterium]
MKIRNRSELKLIPQVRNLRLGEGCLKTSDLDAILIPKADEHYIRSATFVKENIFGICGIKVSPTSSRHCRSPLELRYTGISDSEEYELHVAENRVLIEGKSPVGLFRGAQTFVQLFRNCPDAVPCLEISDSPDFPVRGFYHDVTRGKVPRLDTLKELADILSFYKINQLQLYIEHTFAFRDIPQLWVDKDPITPEDILELDKYCRDRYIDLVPSLATFGHLYELLRLKRFEHLNELQIRASQLPRNLWDRMAHYTLDVSNPESFLLVKSMIEEFLPLFSSPYFNICCDETFDLGKGKNAERTKKEGAGRLYVEFVKKIMKVVTDSGKKPMLWGDIVVKYPDMIPELSDDAVFLNWDYTPEVSSSAVDLFRKAGVKQYVCPGVQGWSRFSNDLNRACTNISRLVRFGKAAEACGVLNTDWGDCAHVNFLANSFHGLAFGAALSWRAQDGDDLHDFDTRFTFLQWGIGNGRPASLLRELGELCFYHFGNLYAWVTRKDCLWNKEEQVEKMDVSDLCLKYSRALELVGELEMLRCSQSDRPVRLDFDEFVWSARVTAWILALLAFKKKYEFLQIGIDEPVNPEQLIRDGYLLVIDFKSLWRRRNRESELRDVVATFVGALNRIEEISHSRGS